LIMSLPDEGYTRNVSWAICSY